jgi:IQ calmodulin-binding motif
VESRQHRRGCLVSLCRLARQSSVLFCVPKRTNSILLAVQAGVRGMAARSEARRRRQRRAATLLQSHWRKHLARRQFLRTRRAATTIQSAYRGRKAREYTRDIRCARHGRKQGKARKESADVCHPGETLCCQMARPASAQQTDTQAVQRSWGWSGGWCGVVVLMPPKPAVSWWPSACGRGSAVLAAWERQCQRPAS